MKYIFSILAFLFVSCLSAQTTEVTVEKQADEIIVTTTTYDASGNIDLIDPERYTLDEFAALSLEINNQKLVEIDREELAIIRQTRDVNQLRRFVIDSLGVQYDSLKTARYGQVLLGDATLIERDGPVTSITISENPNNPNNQRIVETDGERRAGAVLWIHSEKFELRNFFTDPAVTFVSLDGARWRGVDSSGNVYVIRK